jgi:hypothetical protein
MAMIDNSRNDDKEKSCGRSNAKYSGKRSNRKKKNTNRGNRKDDSRYSKESEHVSESNDIAWYSKNPSLLNAAASLPYAYPVGDRLDLENEQFNPESLEIPINDRMPGILTLYAVPGPGISSGELNGDISAVNVAARDIYSFVRYANSGHSNYDPADIMMYMLAIDEIYMEIADAQRIYGIVNLINPQNRFVPKYLVEALGWDYDKVMSNLAQFRFFINSAAARVAALNMPMGFPYFDRHRWLYSNIYVDGTSPKAQILAFAKRVFRVYNETGDHGSALVADSRPDKVDPAWWASNVTNMINAVVGSEDCGIISGDILKAFGTDKCYSAQYMPDNYYVVPSYDEEVLSQFANATVYEGYADVNITQNPEINKGTVIYTPKAMVRTGIDNLSAANPAYGRQILSFQKNVVSPEDTIVGSRLTSILDSKGATYSEDTHVTTARVRTCGSEFIVGARVWKLVRTANDIRCVSTSVPSFVFSFRDGTVAGFNPSGNPFEILSDLSKFRFHTPVTVINLSLKQGAVVSSDFNGIHFIRDIDTYTVVGVPELHNMHEQSILSEFSTPITLKVSGKV